ncbi:fructosamine kinase family protein [Salipaludibacillus sp. HK11]|uniref:fructosamine kinase family protein n=1 Tax=Salipaludibacillus sp. HK11 TaxID=3394320 RepID=UPI0039FDA8D2
MRPLPWMKEAMTQVGIHSEIISMKPISGGEINQAYYVETDKSPIFIKANAAFGEDFFQSEAEGLMELKERGGVLTPDVFGLFTINEGHLSGCVMEWIESKQGGSPKLLAETVAKLHKVTSAQYGYKDRTFVGEIVQQNGWWDNWCEYYQMMRIQPQMRLAEQLGYMPLIRRRRLEALVGRMNEWIPTDDITPRLLHGDLWAGNWMIGKNRLPYLIDPSILYGHHEFELAYTELFGGFPEEFYDVYQQILPIDREYKNRKPLYQLFFLLVHLNTFGEKYGSHVDTVLKRYVG